MSFFAEMVVADITIPNAFAILTERNTAFITQTDEFAIHTECLAALVTCTGINFLTLFAECLASAAFTIGPNDKPVVRL